MEGEGEGQPPFLDEGFLYCSDQQSPSSSLLLLLTKSTPPHLHPYSQRSLFTSLSSSSSVSLHLVSLFGATISATLAHARYSHVSVWRDGLLQGTVYAAHG